MQTLIAEPAQYGPSAIDELARWIAISVEYLHRCARVATTFGSEERIDELADRAMADGGYITPEHLFLLVVVKSSELQRSLLDRIYEESLSTRALCNEIVAADPNAHMGRRRTRRPPGTASLLRTVHDMGRMMQSLGNKLPGFESSFVDGICNLPPDRVDPILIHKFETMIAATKELQDRPAELLKEMEKGLAHLRRVCDARTAQETKKAQSEKHE